MTAGETGQDQEAGIMTQWGRIGMLKKTSTN